MRIFERLLYILNISFMVWYEFSTDLRYKQNVRDIVNICFAFTIATVILCSAFKEGLRSGQYLSLILFLSISIMILFEVYMDVVFIIHLLLQLSIIMNNLVYGEGNLSRINLDGPYEVGHKDFHLRESGTAISVYYPMDKHEYSSNIKKEGRNTKWFRYEEKSLLGLARATADVGKQDHLPPWMFKYLLNCKMYTC